MASYINKPWCTVVSKHKILMILAILKFAYFILIAYIICFVFLSYENVLAEWFKYFLFFPVIYSIVVYSFFKLALSLIEYFYSFVILSWDNLYIIRATLVLRDEIEVIDSLKIIEIDSHARWLVQNIFWFWTIRVELQTREELNIRFVPKPYILLKQIKKQREEILEERKKKYIVEMEK